MRLRRLLFYLLIFGPASFKDLFLHVVIAWERVHLHTVDSVLHTFRYAFDLHAILKIN